MTLRQNGRLAAKRGRSRVGFAAALRLRGLRAAAIPRRPGDAIALPWLERGACTISYPLKSQVPPVGTARGGGQGGRGVLVFGLAHGDLGLAPRSKAGAGNRDRDSGVSGATLSRAAFGSQPVSRALGERRGQGAWAERAGATIAAHGMTTPVRTNGDATASAGASAAGQGAKAQKIVLKKQAPTLGPAA